MRPVKRLLKRLAKILLALFLLAVCAGLVWLYTMPPDLLRVGSGYAAKIVCSNVFLAGRDENEVLADDVQAPGHPLLRLMRVSVDRQAQRVSAALLGQIAPSSAVYRAGLGCAVVPQGAEAAELGTIAMAPPSGAQANAAWPFGNEVQPQAAAAALLERDDLVGPGFRAVVVVKNGAIVAERYRPGFTANTPLLGWSMTKTVNAALIGRLLAEGRMKLDDRNLMRQWAGDARREITLAQLLAMESGLAFNEDYGTVADVTRMLYLEPDMAAFTASLPLDGKPGERFNYSSGTAVLLSRIWMDRLGDRSTALAFPKDALFGPLGMRSAVMEADASGTFVGSSYLYANARDWARFGLLLAQDGVWNGERLLPEGFVAAMSQPTTASGGRYSRMQTWLPRPSDRAELPADTFNLQGHDGQSVTVIPSEGIVIVRLGLSPWWTGYSPSALSKEVVKTLR
ncbi:serine hydrolase domain-containing protein [Rhizobium sp. SL86]|uniref:serine hydrolase domain-containing protein n=1 Tax=Rhizobium sp. SL86 TaxID=2995148 RepID=UPI002274B03B|nr:serine hydrolase [Rhizobium sp. SL86]MCY1669250.1 serine hydrolase [Rhizobium sp. SL86]